MLLPLPMKIGEVGHGQHRRTAARRAAEQRGLKPVIVPLGCKRPRDLGSFCALQVLVCGAEANRATSGDRSQPQADFKLQSKNFFNLAHGQSPGWQADPPLSRGRLPAIVLSSATTYLWKSFRRSRTQFRDWPETVRLHPGTGVHLHPGILFEIIPEHRSESSRNRVHLTPDSPQRTLPLVTPNERRSRGTSASAAGASIAGAAGGRQSGHCCGASVGTI